MHSTLLAVHVVDLLTHLKLLDNRLVKTIASLRHKSLGEFMKFAHLDSFHLDSLIEMGPLQDIRIHELSSEDDCCASTTQAHVLDYMRMVGRYKVYVRFQVFAIWLVWLVMTAAYSSWLNVHKFQELPGEFRWGYIVLAIMAISSVSICAYVESRSRKLYRLICIAMAIDDDLLGTRLRWCHLAQYFSPKPLYCFTALDRTKFSWLFCMQVSS